MSEESKADQGPVPTFTTTILLRGENEKLVYNDVFSDGIQTPFYVFHRLSNCTNLVPYDIVAGINVVRNPVPDAPVVQPDPEVIPVTETQVTVPSQTA
jgi:hypothetical protein